MKYTTSILLGLIAPLIAAQSVADLPSCSLSCVISGVQEVGCTVSEFSCSCKKADQLTPAITPCVQKACTDPADQAKVITVLGGICASAGFPITIPEPVASAASTSEAAKPTPTEEAPKSEAPKESSVAPTIETSAAPSTTAAADETCTVETVTETVTAGVPSSEAPYPTSAGTGSPIKPTGTGAYTTGVPMFTGAATAMKVPAGIAGVVGLAAYFL